MIVGKYKCNAYVNDELTIHVIRDIFRFTIFYSNENCMEVHLTKQQVKQLIQDLKEVVEA